MVVCLCGSAAVAQAPRKAGPAKSAPAAAADQGAPKWKAIWEPVHVGVDIKLNDVYFVSPDVGWVAGDKGSIYHTKDGGKTWTAQLGGDPAGSEPPVKDLRFLNDKQGWAVLGDGKLLRTTDGESWEEYGKVGEYYGYYYDYLFLSPTEGVQIVKEGDGLFRTQDGGKSWKQVHPRCAVKVEAGGLPVTAPCRLKSLFFTSPETGYAVGASLNPAVFVVLKTNDGGNSWVTHATVPDVAHVDESYSEQYIAFTDANNAVAVLRRWPKTLITSDGGATWRGVISQAKGPVKFADAQVGWSFNIDYDANRPTFSYTSNGGKTWGSRQMQLPGVPHAFCVPRRDRGYLVGDHGMVFRYRVIPESEPTPPKAILAPLVAGAPK